MPTVILKTRKICETARNPLVRVRRYLETIPRGREVALDRIAKIADSVSTNSAAKLLRQLDADSPTPMVENVGKGQWRRI